MRILFFSPFANVWDHSLVEYGVANTLAELGNEVYLTGCKGMFLPQCIATNEAKLPFMTEMDSSTKQVCVSCQNRSNLLSEHFDSVERISLEDFENSGDERVVQDFLASISKDDFLERDFQGIQVCKIAMYEFSLKYKLRSANFADDYWAEFMHQLRNVLVTTICFKRLLTKIEPDRVVVHNSLYSLNQTACKIAELSGIPSYSIGVGQNFSQRQNSFSLFRSPQDWIALSRSKAWFKYSRNRNSQIDIKICDEHFINIMSGKNPWTYSRGVSNADEPDVLSFFGIADGQKVCLATLSSEDEYFAANLINAIPDATTGSTFVKTQYEWLSMLIGFFEKNPDLVLIIRVHPREFPNKRDYVTAESVVKLKQLLNELPSNVKVNWPDDGISIYALADKTDLLLNWRSTVGVEFLALGIPVLVPSDSDLLSYPIEFNHVGSTAFEYESLILELVDRNWSMTNVYNAYKWLTFLSNFAALPIKSSARAPQRISMLRPVSPGFALKLWERLVSMFLKFAPLVLERRSIQNWSLTNEQAHIVNEALKSQASSLADTELAMENESSVCIDLEETLRELSTSLMFRVSIIQPNPELSYILARMMGSDKNLNR